MENVDEQKGANATYSPDDLDIGEELADNEIASGSVGTRKDQLDMRRMGKSQELTVRSYSENPIISRLKSESVTLDSGPC